MAIPELELLKDIGLPAGYVALLAVIYYLLRMVERIAKDFAKAINIHTIAITEITTLLKVLVANGRR